MPAINPEPNRLPDTTQPINPLNNNPPGGVESPVPLKADQDKDEEEDLKTLDHTSLANTFIDKWKIGAEVGRGGFAVVYKTTATFADGVEVAAAFKAGAKKDSKEVIDEANNNLKNERVYKKVSKNDIGKPTADSNLIKKMLHLM